MVKLLQKQRFFLPQISKIKTGEELISSFDIDNINPIPLLFQAGYLTIKEVLQVGVITQYTLGFPNLEVKSAFNNSLVDLFFPSLRKNEVQTDIYLALYNGDLDKFKSAVHALFAAIPYHNYTNNEIARYEGFYASVIYAWLASSRLSLTVEDCTNKGRIDMSVDMEDAIYLIEFKVDQEGKALEQIRAKNYPEKFLAKSVNGGKEIVLIGIGFSSVEKNVTEFVWEKVAMD